MNIECPNINLDPFDWFDLTFDKICWLEVHVTIVVLLKIWCVSESNVLEDFHQILNRQYWYIIQRIIFSKNYFLKVLVNMALFSIWIIFLGYAIVQLPELAFSIYKYVHGRLLAYGISRQEVNSGENSKSKQRRKTVWYAKTPGEFDNSVVNEFKRWTEEDFDIFIKVASKLIKKIREEWMAIIT